MGVYGYVNDAVSAESVLANNPDSGTDAGQFAMIENVSTNDKKIEFEFIAAVPKEKVSTYLEFYRSLKKLTYQQLIDS